MHENDDSIMICKHPQVDGVIEVEPVGVCDNYREEQHGN